LSRVLAPAFALLMAACASAEPNAPVVAVDRTVAADAGAEVTLAPGETAEISSVDLRVRFNRVLGDSRCPTKAGVMCVWAGSVVVELQGGPITGRQFLETRRVESAPGRDTTSIAGQPIRLVRVSPEKETLSDIPAASYRIVLRAGTPK
jgi:hypothetical protein